MMSIYFNPPLQIEFEARELKPERTFKGLTRQLKSGERLFALAMRGIYPQCIYLYSNSLYQEYCSVIHRVGHFNGFYAMSAGTWKKYFPGVPERWAQQGIEKPSTEYPEYFHSEQREGLE